MEKEVEEAYKNLSEIIELCKDDINSNNINATLNLENLKSLKIVLQALDESFCKIKQLEADILQYQYGLAIIKAEAKELNDLLKG